MKKTGIKLIILFVMISLLFTNIFFSAAFAEDEDQTDESTLEEDSGDAITESSADVDTFGGYKGLVAHWKFDSNFNDSSQFKNDGAAVGTRTGITFVDGVFGKAARFDGKSYIEVKDSDSLDLRSEFTFSLWVYKDDMREKHVPYIMKMNEQDDVYPYTLWEWWDLSPGVSVNDGEDDLNNQDISAEKEMDIHKWALLTASSDGSTVKIYYNDELVTSKRVSASLKRSSQPLYIGFGSIANDDSFFKGIMDDVRIYNKALTYDEVEGLYIDGIKGKGKDLVLKPNKLIAFYRFEGNCSDVSGFNNNGTAVNARGGIAYVDALAGKGAKFNGASYIEVKDSDSLEFERSFTIGAWINKDKKDEDQPIIAKYGETHTKDECSYKLADINGSMGQQLQLMNFEDGLNMDDFNTDTEIANGRWYYYTATYDGKNVKIYIDGVLKQTMPYTADISNSSGPMWIGGTTDTIFFKGIMDELRIYNYALTPTQVKNVYNYRDYMQVGPADKKLSIKSLKVKQNLQLKVVTLIYSFTAPNASLPNGKDFFKQTDVTNKAVYQSNKTSVVAVSKTGMLTIKGKGKAVVTVKYGKFIQNTTIEIK